MNVVKLFASKISFLIEKRKENKRIEKELIFNRRREYIINKLNHTWTKEERDSYDDYYTVKNEGIFGGNTAAEYQNIILDFNWNYLTPEEREKFSKDIQLRLLLEKKEKLLSKMNDNQTLLTNTDEQIKELRKVGN